MCIYHKDPQQGLSTLHDVLQGKDGYAICVEQHTPSEAPSDHQAIGQELFSSLRESEPVERFYRETVGRLERYDLLHGADLVRTLDAFFACNANSLQTARLLRVHRNTMSNRLRRIAEITRLDLANAETRLALQLALKIRQLAR